MMKENDCFNFTNRDNPLKYGMGALVNTNYRFDNTIEYKTSIENVDNLIGGGIIGGSMVEIHGDTATGKTLLALEYLKDAQKKNKKTAIFDYDMNLNLDFAAKIGVDLSQTEIINIPNAEETFSLIFSMVKSNQYGVIIIDSVPAILPGEEINKPYKDLDNTTQSKLISDFLFKVKPQLIKSNTILIFTNQTRMSFTGLGYRTVGGRTFKSFMDIRLFLKKDSDIVVKDDIIGIKTDISLIQNKLYNKILNTTIEIIFDYGIIRY